MKKCDLVKIIDVNGEERGHGLFMDSFVPQDRDLTVFDMLDQMLESDHFTTSIDIRTKHFEVFVDGNVKFLNAIYWSLCPMPTD